MLRAFPIIFFALLVLFATSCRQQPPEPDPGYFVIELPDPEPEPEEELYILPEEPEEEEPVIVQIQPDILNRFMPALDYRNYLMEGGRFELPAVGATGFTAIRLHLWSMPNHDASIVYTMEPGQPFVILDEYDEWWQIEIVNSDGWLMAGWAIKRFTMINLPDVIPSIVFNNTNTLSSLFRTSGLEIPGITGEALYYGLDFNERFGRYEFIMPILYGTAQKLMIAQQLALADGRTLVLYEAFRPHDAHNKVYDSFRYLFDTNPDVRANIETGGYTFIRFLAPSPYNHQRGTAVDLTLGRIVRHEIRSTGDFMFLHISEYEEYQMQSPMHELSVASAIFVVPVVSHNLDAWRAGVFRDIVTEGTRLLVDYMDKAGFTPLSAEWWHFNDIPNTDDAIWMGSVGQFNIERSYSRPPWTP
ncbi:MAG: hypothetical protein FWG66_09715 [Spirochaetes bacterium]|nr:hypothetical protein [Spirochaetota bacterium]